MQTVSSFNREYDRLARHVDPELVGCGPKKAQFYRWLAGDLSGLPYPHHCRILQAMFPEWSIGELFDQHSERIGAPAHRISGPESRAGIDAEQHQVAGVEAVYLSRMDFLRALPPQELFRDVQRIDMAGLSLNLLCQQCSDTDILALVRAGTHIRCLFLDPDGVHIRHRESEEGHAAGVLRSLTDLNIRTLAGIRARLPGEAAGSISIRIYDAPVRYNITLVDSGICVVQPYLPTARGVDSPTFVARRSDRRGLFDTFAEVFETMWMNAQDGVSG
ncbi:DUF5919 domain-containing protein [Nocardia sp. SYP-A9097]|uniref:DUF5919 domain-containing protein n=1 Tax=Nocardia sp. SYP-A9097 TaxID=2663237 RepID=UPI001E325083|nr:DUF5919 domain-containing protein [Nocardia sp. SYP-A9097]